MISCFLNMGIFFIVLGALGVYEGFALRARTEIEYGPGQYLIIVSALILIVGIVYYFQTLKKTKKAAADPSAADNTAAAETEEEEKPQELPKGVAPCFTLKFRLGQREIKIGPAILAFVLFVLYAILTRWIGYLISTALFVVSAMLLFGERVWWRLALFGVISGVSFWAVFVRFASIPL